MNILITLNNGYVDFALIMLVSLFEHNKKDITVYCLYHNLSLKSQERLSALVHGKKGEIHFLKTDKNIYENFPVIAPLTIECYFILLAHLILPYDIDRILYLDSDLIVEQDLDELYRIDLDGYYMAAAGQFHRNIDGHPYRSVARPDRGECFNSGVIVFNLKKMRMDITAQTYLEAAKRAKYNFTLADQGLLNMVFYDKTKYLDTLRYNFRMLIYRNYLKDGHNALEYSPAIIHFSLAFYWRIGVSSKPWTCTLSKMEERLLTLAGCIRQEYGMDEWVRMNRYIHLRFWHYAKKAGVHRTLWYKMKANKRRILGRIADWGTPLLLKENIRKQQEKEAFFRRITDGDNSVKGELSKFLYKDIEKYIDAMDADAAICTMRNLFRMNCEIFTAKKIIRVGFFVYSSTEWQCDNLYWKLEDDSNFEPVIIICGYGHGSLETVRKNFFVTGKYFRESGRKYRMRYAGYIGYNVKDEVEDCDVLVYMMPHDLHPYPLNIGERPLSQLAVHIPYAVYLSDRSIGHYSSDEYNTPVFKVFWRYFCVSAIHKKITEKESRLGAFNAVVSGLPKLDSFCDKTYIKRERIWKMAKGYENPIKLIWAPHWSMAKGTLGTFNLNYKWFYNYAKNHPELSWVVRPHPRLVSGAIAAGVFESEREYEEYMNSWDSLPNAAVIEGGGYYDIFDSSDAMIHDSISFLAVYLYTGKPMLRLLPDYPRAMNELGREIEEVVYSVNGDDFESIENFIGDVRQGVDKSREARIRLFDNTLNYFKLNGKCSTDFIYGEFCKSMKKQNEP